MGKKCCKTVNPVISWNNRPGLFNKIQPFVAGGIPFPNDLVFDFDTRTDLDLIDRIAGETATIGNFVCGDYVPASTPQINLGDRPQFSFGDGVTDSAFWVSAWINMDDATAFRILCKRANATAEWIFTTGGADTLLFVLYDATNVVLRGRATAALTAQEGNWIHVMACYNGVGGVNAQNGINIYVNNVVSDIADLSGGVYTAMHDTASELNVGYLESSNDHADGEMYDIRLGSGTLTAAQRATIMNGGFVGSEINIQQDGYSGIDISGNAYHGVTTGMAKGYSPNSYKLLNGFTQYWDNATGLVSLQLPYDVNGVPINPAAKLQNGANYTRSELHPVNAFHNLAECFIDFNPTNSAGTKWNIFNRSLAAIFNANARVALPVGYYNAAEPWTFHISELSQYELAGYYQVGQRRKTYIQGTTQSILQAARLNLDRVFVYATDKIDNNDISVLTFTNDIVQVVTDAGGNYIFDANGYAVLINT